MIDFYTICAIAGTFVLVVQIVLMLLGMHGDGGMDAGHDFDVGHDFDAGHDFGGGHDFDVSAAGDATDLTHDGQVHMMEDTQLIEGASTWFFQMLSFRAIVAAVAFFGVGGRLGNELHLGDLGAFGLALGAGLFAMALVAWLMQMLANLRDDGTVRVQYTVGLPATVYLRIPAERSGVGKISLTVQSRNVEFEAVTDGEEIPTGRQVMVTQVVNDTTLAVAPDTLAAKN